MSDFRTALGPSGPQDAQDGLNMGNVAPRLVPEARNYAEDQATVQLAQNEIAPLLQQARMDRKPTEQIWAQIRRMEMMQHDENQRYTGRSNAYVPVYTKNLNTKVSQIVRALFPSDEYVDCMSADPTADKLAAKQYMQYQFEKIAFLRTYMQLFARQLENYSFSVLKYWYRKPRPYAKARGKKVTVTDLMGLMSNEYTPDFQQDGTDQGLTVSARSIFNFYAYPFTAETLRECTLHFEDIKMSMAELKYWARVEGWKVDNLEIAPRPSELSSDEAEKFAVNSIANPEGSNQGTQLGDIRGVTEVYTFLQLPKAAYTGADSPDCPLPVRIIFLGDVPVHIQRNPNYSQSSPFLGLSLNNSPGFFHGYSSGKMIAPLQYLVNDFTNQTNDVCIYGLNPGVKAIPGMLVGQMRPMAPGVTWYMNDLNAVDFFHPPTEQVGVGQGMVQMLMAMAQDFGGAPPILQGTSAKGSGKTATGSQILQSNATGPLQDLTESIENEIMVPLSSNGFLLAQQHAPDRILADVFGVMREITKDQLLFQARWRWLASSQAANAQMRAYQATNFIQLVNSVIPVLAQAGVQVNLLPLLKRVGADALGFRGLDEVFIQGAPPVMGGQPGVPGPGVAPDQGGAPRSPAESANGGALPMQPGEEGGFGDARQQSDMISAMMGGMQGGGNGEPF